MDFSDTPENSARKETLFLAWQQQMHEDDWVGLSRPGQYGGHGLTQLHETIFGNEERSV